MTSSKQTEQTGRRKTEDIIAEQADQIMIEMGAQVRRDDLENKISQELTVSSTVSVFTIKR